MSASAQKCNSLCRTCGNEANNECSGCEGAFYCSKECQRWDWKTGKHKTLCRGPDGNKKIHIILRELFVAEYEWLKTITPTQKQELLLEDTQHDKLNHIFISGEVALVLARCIPCMVPFNVMMHTASFSCAYIIQVLAPWVKRHEEFLEEQGFAVDAITHGVYVANLFCQCSDTDPCGELADFYTGYSHGTVIIRDLRSPDSELVKKVFLSQRSEKMEEWTTEEHVKMKDLLQCISFRPSKADLLTISKTVSLVYYAFKFPNQVFGNNEEVCCSAALKFRFFVDSDDATILGEHFRRCYDAMEAIGFPIMLDLKHPENWTDAAIAKTVRAAAGDMDTLRSWQENGCVPFCLRTDEVSRVYRILQLCSKKEEWADGKENKEN